MSDELTKLRDENRRLRAVFPKILAALNTGAMCSSNSDIEFLENIPNEVALVIKHLRKMREDCSV